MFNPLNDFPYFWKIIWFIFEYESKVFLYKYILYNFLYKIQSTEIEKERKRKTPQKVFILEHFTQIAILACFDQKTLIWKCSQWKGIIKKQFFILAPDFWLQFRQDEVSRCQLRAPISWFKISGSKLIVLWSRI